MIGSKKKNQCNRTHVKGQIFVYMNVISLETGNRNFVDISNRVANL